MSVYQNINGTLTRMDASDLVQLAAVDTEGILGGTPGATTNGQTLVDQLAADDVQAQTDIGQIKTDLSDEVETRAALGAHNKAKITATTQTVDGITYTIDQAAGTITASGSLTSGKTKSYIAIGKVSVLAGDILSGCPSGGGSNDYTLVVLNSTQTARIATDEGSEGVANATDADAVIGIYVYKNLTSPIVFKPMVRLASDADPTFAPYAMTNRELTEQKCANSVVAPVENGATASQAYSIGQHFIRDGAFCTAKAAIASGANFTLNTNYTVGNIGDNVDNILNAIAGQYADNGIDANAINSITQYINGWAPNTNMPPDLNNGIGIMFTIATGDYGAIALQTKSSVNKNQLLLATTGFWRRSYTASSGTWSSWTKYSI